MAFLVFPFLCVWCLLSLLSVALRFVFNDFTWAYGVWVTTLTERNLRINWHPFNLHCATCVSHRPLETIPYLSLDNSILGFFLLFYIILSILIGSSCSQYIGIGGSASQMPPKMLKISQYRHIMWHVRPLGASFLMPRELRRLRWPCPVCELQFFHTGPISPLFSSLAG